MLGDRGAHGLRLHFPEDGRVLDIGEQEGDDLHLQLRLEQERRVLVEDPSLELLQLRRGIEAQFLRQVRSRLLVRAKSFRLTTRAVQREHVLPTEALVDGKLLAQHLELCDQLGVSSERELSLDPQLDGAEAQLLESPRFELERERAGHVCVRVAAPQRERRTESLGGLGGSGLHQPACLVDRPLELDRVDVFRLGDESIAPSSRTMTSPIAALRFETYVCSVERAPAVGSSPQTPSIRVSTETGVPTSAASSASTVRCFGPPRRTSTPSLITSRDPRTRTFTSERRYDAWRRTPSPLGERSPLSLMRPGGREGR